MFCAYQSLISRILGIIAKVADDFYVLIAQLAYGFMKLKTVKNVRDLFADVGIASILLDNLKKISAVPLRQWTSIQLIKY